MNKARSIVDRLLEADEPVSPQQPEQPAPEGEEDIRDLFFRLTQAPEPFHARGTAGTGTRRYQRMAEQLGRRSSLKIDNHTYLIRDVDGNISVRFHKTNIATYAPDGTATFTTGGWPTRSTRERMSNFIPGDWAIYSEPFKKHGEEAPELWWEMPANRYGDRGGREIRGGIGKLFWYNRATNAGTWESGWYIPFTDGDSITPDGTLRHQAKPKQRGQKKAAHGWP